MATVMILFPPLQSLINVFIVICRELIEELEDQLNVKDS